MPKTHKFYSAVFLLAVMVLTITFSIGLPIYIRPFYYAHVDALDMPETYGVERQDIIDAYDEVLDFLTKDGHEFGTGVLEYSEEGKSHFEDCRVLFNINKYAFIASLVLVVLLLFLDNMAYLQLARPCGLSLGFFSGLGTLGLFGTLAVLVARDFGAAFTTFHKIFFPGKENWIFNPTTDEIILFMPSEFFMDCAVLIGFSVILTSIVLMINAWRKRYTL